MATDTLDRRGRRLTGTALTARRDAPQETG